MSKEQLKKHITKRQFVTRVLIIVCIFFCLLYSWFLLLNKDHYVKLGTDLKGGMSITLSTQGKTNADAINRAIDILKQRVNSFGVSDTSVYKVGTRNVVIETSNNLSEEDLSAITRSAVLNFRPVYYAYNSIQGKPLDVHNNQAKVYGVNDNEWEDYVNLDCTKQDEKHDNKNIILCDNSVGNKYLLGDIAVRGKDVKSSKANITGMNGATEQWGVSLNFNLRGTRDLRNVTDKLSQTSGMLAIVLDNKVISAPYVNKTINDGNTSISGGFNKKSAQFLSNTLQYGSLPVHFKIETLNKVSPTLSGNQLHHILLVGLLSLVCIAIYGIIKYKICGIISILTLCISILLAYPIFVILSRSIDYTFTLPGFAGVIVAIGIMADSFVVFMERIKDGFSTMEVPKPYLIFDIVWKSIIRTILIADGASILIALSLYIFEVGDLKGFAFNLAFVTIIDIIILCVVTYPLIVLIFTSKRINNNKGLLKYYGIN